MNFGEIENSGCVIYHSHFISILSQDQNCQKCANKISTFVCLLFEILEGNKPPLRGYFLMISHQQKNIHLDDFSKLLQLSST